MSRASSCGGAVRRRHGGLPGLPGGAASLQGAMATFEAATDQGLSQDKTVILPMGLPGPEATAAGGAGAPDCPCATPPRPWVSPLAAIPSRQQADWPAMLSQAQSPPHQAGGAEALSLWARLRLLRLRRLQLLYLAEFTGLPPPETLAAIITLVAKLVSQGQPPDGPARFSGIRADLVAGNPREGGFGALYWRPHILARHAVWGRRLCCDRSAPWAAVARHIMLAVAGHDHPLTLLAWTCGTPPAAAATLPPPLARLLHGLASLPPPTLQALTPGDWCRDAPLFGNPYIRLEDGATCLDALFGELTGSPIQTVGDALAAAAAVECTTREYVSGVRAALFGGVGQAASAYLDHSRAQERLGRLAALIPATWQLAAQHTGAAPAADAAAHVMLAGVAWKPADGGDAISLPSLTVKAGTMLQAEVQLCAAERRARFAAYAALAGDHRPTAPKAVRAMLDRLWRTPCRNKHKEVLWRLVLRALPLASRMPGSDLGGCGCGHTSPAPDRQHHYWDCPIAKGVLDTISAQLGPSQRPLAQAHVWLARAPPGLHAGVWDVMCLLAVAAMDKGRRHATRLMLPSGTSAQQRAHGAAAAPQRSSGTTAGPALAAAAAARAGAWLWEQLEEVCSLGLLPASWQAAVDSSHPFIIWRAAEQRWSARCPP